jgi:hypothetical protein
LKKKEIEVGAGGAAKNVYYNCYNFYTSFDE